MTGNDKKFAAVRVWLDRELNAEAVDRDDPRAVLLASYLFYDVQAGELMARDNLKWLDAVLSGKSETEVTTGNAHTVLIERQGVRIGNNYLQALKSFSYSHDEYRAALEQVLAVMRQAKG